MKERSGSKTEKYKKNKKKRIDCSTPF